MRIVACVELLDAMAGLSPSAITSGFPGLAETAVVRLNGASLRQTRPGPRLTPFNSAFIQPCIVAKHGSW
jgi:hypothetical protein